jgi:hypothetical protein
MANVSVAASLPVSPDQAWKTASDLCRFEEWLVLHEAWRGPVPEEITAGTVLTSVVTVGGLRNRMDWTVRSFEPPALITLSGQGKTGVQVSMALSVSAEGTGSSVGIDIEFSAPGLLRPIRSAVARALKRDLQHSLEQLVELIG